MKIIKIFGAVLALHGLAFLVIFANPGCSITKRPIRDPALNVANPSAETPPPMINLAALPVSINAAPGGGTPATVFDPNAPAISEMERYSPNRPVPVAPAASVPSATAAAPVEPPKTYTVVGGDSLWTIAKKNEVSVAELTRANNLAANAVIRPGQKLVIPTKPALAAAREERTPGAATYRVKANETLGGIARRAGITTVVLRELNALTTDVLRVGQELRLPPGVTVAPESATPKAAENVFTHVVQAGETLETIARKYQMRVGEIAAANNIANPSLIQMGSALVIPGWQPVAKTPETAAAAKSGTAPAAVPGPGQDLNSGLQQAPGAPPVIRIDTPLIPIK